MNNAEDVYEILKNGGWYKDRKMDHDKIIKFINTEGYDVLDNVIAFLQEFLNLTVYFNNKRNGLKNDDFDFVLEKAAGLEVPERLRENYSPRIGKKLCIIGSAYRDHMVLMMAEDNSVYGAFDDFLCKIGDSGMDAIEAIIFDYDFKEIP